MKAFLSHSSHNKEFVRAVAKELGRQLCIFDEQVFNTGDEFKSSIEKGLDESSIFVLFASKEALESIWVSFETEEAWYKKLQKHLAIALVYIIDSSITIEDIPKWLQRGLIRSENVAKVIARDIKLHLNKSLQERHQKFFVGRNKDIEKLESILTPTDGSFPPHVIFITGLLGIGRRALVKYIAPKLLNLSKYVEIRIQEGDSINDICLKVADHIEPYSTNKGFRKIANDIQKLSDNEALKRTLKNLRKLTELGDLPILYDDKGVMSNEGYLSQPIRSIIAEITPVDEAYVFIISKRRPNLALSELLPILAINELSHIEIKRLITVLAKQREINISIDKIDQLAEYIAGYPPAAYFAFQQIEVYGVSVVLDDKSNLIKFRTGIFFKHLVDTDLSENEKSILQLLSMHSPLPLQILASVSKIPEHELHNIIIKLIDLSLVIPTEEGLYRIAEPIVEAASNAFGLPSLECNQSLVNSLHDLLRQSDTEYPRLDLSRVFFRAAYLTGDECAQKKAFHMASDLITLTETFYHNRDYKKCINCAYTALLQRPNNILAREFLIKALIQEEEWLTAEKEIQNFAVYAPERDVHFLKGFIKRRKGDINDAITEYKEAEKFGRKGVALSRELAHCYFFSGDYNIAAQYIQKAIDRHGDNRYLVDLWVKIEKHLGDENKVKQALARLRAVDRPNYYQHRLSTVKLAFGYPVEALQAAKKAVDFVENPPFEHLYQLTRCEIELKHSSEAKNLLAKLERDFGHKRHDLRKSLWCRYEIANGNYSKALEFADGIIEKGSTLYKVVRRDAIQGELSTSALSDDVRIKYEEELSRLNQELERIKAKDFLAIDVD